LFDHDLYLIEKQRILLHSGKRAHSMLAFSLNNYYKDRAIRKNSKNFVLTN
jgi:hypothetical protein